MPFSPRYLATLYKNYPLKGRKAPPAGTGLISIKLEIPSTATQIAVGQVSSSVESMRGVRAADAAAGAHQARDEGRHRYVSFAARPRIVQGKKCECLKILIPAFRTLVHPAHHHRRQLPVVGLASVHTAIRLSTGSFQRS
jgi:hypothetical protein